MTDRGDSFVNVEHQAFSALYSTLRRGIRSDLSHVVSEAFSRDLIPQRVKAIAGNASSLQTEDDRACTLLDAIHERIQNRPQSYQEFADILESIPAFRYLAENMIEKKNDLVEKGTTQNNGVFQEGPKDVESKRRLSSTSGKLEGLPDQPLLALADFGCQNSNELAHNSLDLPLLSPIEHSEIDEAQEPEIQVVAEGDNEALIPPDPISNEGETVSLPSSALVNNEEHPIPAAVQRSPEGDFLCGWCCSGITFILLALFILGIIELGYGIRILLRLEPCGTVGVENLFGSYNVLFGVTLISGVLTVSPLSIYNTSRRYGYCTARKWRILICFSAFSALSCVVLLLALFIYSMFMTIAIYPSVGSFPNDNANCSRVTFYSTVISLTVTHILLGIFAIVLVIGGICWCCVRVITITMCPETLMPQN